MEAVPEGVIEDAAPRPLLSNGLALRPVLLPASHPADLPTVPYEAAVLAPGETPTSHASPALLAHLAPATRRSVKWEKIKKMELLNFF